MGEKGPQPGLPFAEDEEGKKVRRLTIREIAAMQDKEPNCPQCEVGGGTCPKHPVEGERAA